MDNLVLVGVALGFWGFSVGTFMILLNLVIIEYLGLDKLISVVSVSSIPYGLIMFVFGAAAG